MVYSIALALTVVFALASSIGGVVYLAWNLSPWAMIVIIATTLVAAFFILPPLFKKRSQLFEQTENTETDNNQTTGGNWWAIGLLPLIVFCGVCIILAFRNQTENAINTPWKQLPQLFWISMTLAAANGAALLLCAKKNTVFITTLVLTLLGTTIATIVFKIGYGYDPFVHQAAEEHILRFGVIEPKTIYYSGQYAVVTIISFLTKLSIHDIDVWLLPLLAPLGIAAASSVAVQTNKWRQGAMNASIIALLPLSVFINTTPYGLAALYTLLAAIIGLAAVRDTRFKIIVWVFASAALLTHPIAGVPAIILAGCIQFKKPLLKILIALGGTVILPALFAWTGKGISFSLARISSINLPFELPLSRFHSLGDSIYLIGALSAIIIIIGVINNRTYLLTAASAAISGLSIAVFVDFSYLPGSEQGGYAARLLMLALLIAAPAAAASIGTILSKPTISGWRIFAAITVIAFFFTSGVYLAYPREDAYVISKGWNTSATDLSAVSAIDKDANGEPYIVLAAQPVSAAALSRFGFFKYYDTPEGQIFAYPVPTGGVLYQYFLKMIYTEPSAEYMREAMTLAGVKRGYFVVNSYWTGADHIIGRAKMTSESWFGINNADYVFRYRRE